MDRYWFEVEFKYRESKKENLTESYKSRIFDVTSSDVLYSKIEQYIKERENCIEAPWFYTTVGNINKM